MTSEENDQPEEGSPADLLAGLSANISALGNVAGMLESAQEALSARAEAESQTVEGTAGGGVVKVTMTGGGEVTEVKLDPQVVDPDELEMLQDLIVAAFSDAGAKVTAMQMKALEALGQMDLGALGGGLGGMLGEGSDRPGR